MLSQRALSVIAILAAAPLDALAGQGGNTGSRVSGVERPVLRTAVPSARSSGSVHLDGVLDEPVWAEADSIASLTQIEPIAGSVPRGRTVVRVAADRGALVFGIRADNPPGVDLVAFSRSRDAGLDGEDHIKLVLDTYLDGRSGYVFAVNPNGA